MSKLIVLSIIILSIAMPIMLAERKSPKRAVRLIWTTVVAFAFVWGFLCTWLYPKLVFVQ